ncbi:Transcription initiation factor TFIID subunit 13 [Heterocephalus glaber]|uniref:Transcription initiation factor TFIID subunit 13 n=1 Tax=Heterocephalus glaber TaxID=10181 RepID=G5BSX9_HETGA|nr:Transcription initiation factor TFIID subunit 13 [Heterocephalus glaber]
MADKEEDPTFEEENEEIGGGAEEFITEMTHKAMSIGRQVRVQVEDIVFLIQKDPRKFARVRDLLTMNEELTRARKAFDEANYGS